MLLDMKSTSLEKYISYGNEPPFNEDEDSAPEEIGFEKSKKAVKKVEKQVSSFIRLQNEVIKKKRKSVHERNAAQKRAKLLKLKELEKKRLPSDFLDKVSLLPPRQHQSSISAPAVHSHFKQDLYLEEELPQQHKRSKGKQPIDFISIQGSTKFSVVPLKSKFKNGTASSALNFRNRFLNGTDVQRETVKEMISKTKKQSLKKLFK